MMLLWYHKYFLESINGEVSILPEYFLLMPVNQEMGDAKPPTKFGF